MESKWQIYQNFYHEITVNVNYYQALCQELVLDTQTEFGICNMIYNISIKFITDIFDKLHYIDPDFVEAMIMAIKNHMLLSNKILIEKDEKLCQHLAEIIMDRIIWFYSGSNYGLADIK